MNDECDFYKEFPSLKDLEFIEDDGLYLFAMKDVKENCVDKQKVRDLLKKEGPHRTICVLNLLLGEENVRTNKKV